MGNAHAMLHSAVSSDERLQQSYRTIVDDHRVLMDRLETIMRVSHVCSIANITARIVTRRADGGEQLAMQWFSLMSTYVRVAQSAKRSFRRMAMMDQLSSVAWTRASDDVDTRVHSATKIMVVNQSINQSVSRPSTRSS